MYQSLLRETNPGQLSIRILGESAGGKLQGESLHPQKNFEKTAAIPMPIRVQIRKIMTSFRTPSGISDAKMAFPASEKKMI